MRTQSEGNRREMTMYALIGAGPMGLAAARNLSKHGVPFQGFELHGDVGGLWDIKNPHSTMYESAHLISSKSTTEFKEFPMRDELPAYPNHADMCDYFRDYAKHFDLYKHYRFHTRVEAVEKDGDHWWVTSTHDGETKRERFKGVLIANGTLHHPNRPELPGSFSGRIMHSAEYKSADQLRDQRVLIVGCGNSGADIAVEAVHHAKSVDISLRRGYYFLPKFIGGRPIDTLGGKLKLPRPIKQRVDAAMIRMVVGKPSDYGLPDPDYAMYESHPVMNTLILHHLGQGDIRPRRNIRSVDGHTVSFSDGETGEYDVILLATGYKLHYPFIERSELNWPETEGAPQLYLNVFPPQHDDLVVLGMIEATGLGWEGRNAQAEMVALYLRNQDAKTEVARQFNETKRAHASKRIDGGYAYLPLDRMAYYVHKESYLEALDTATRTLRSGLDEAVASAGARS